MGEAALKPVKLFCFISADPHPKFSGQTDLWLHSANYRLPTLLSPHMPVGCTASRCSSSLSGQMGTETIVGNTMSQSLAWVARGQAIIGNSPFPKQAFHLGGFGSYPHPWLQINPQVCAWYRGPPCLVVALLWE